MSEDLPRSQDGHGIFFHALELTILLVSLSLSLVIVGRITKINLESQDGD